VPDELDLSVDEALAYAQRLLDGGRAFGAHEVLEAIWKASPEPERELWRSLAQLAVAVTHLERGNLRGARELALRATTGLESFRAEAPHQLDLDGLVGVGRRLVVEIDAGQVPAVPQMRLRAGP
jgi:predicted metal-dependent hydrolase